ncbi:hypothetical protein G6F56_014086 [Rhizopus delemar]|nr:hypothetical protein G6F56_014086 [Rhizopus delemar]
MSREVYNCDCSKCTKDGRLFTPIAKSAYYTHQRTSSFRGKIQKRSLVSSMALTAARAAPDEDPFEHLDNDFDATSLDHSPAIPSAQADEDDEEYYSCNEESDSEDSEDDDAEPEGSL